MAGKPLQVESEIRDDLYLIVFSVHNENWTYRRWNDGRQCWLCLGSVKRVAKGCAIAGDAARLFTQKATRTNQPRRYTEGKSRRITFKSMDVYIERRVATEAVRDDRGGFGATGQSIYADVALTRDRSILDTGKVASSA